MSAAAHAPSTIPTRASLDGIPWVDVAENLRTAMFAGTRVSSMLREIVALRRGPGRLTVAEYFYYRLWESGLSLDEKRHFVGKRAQNAMHLACNDHGWYSVTQDKLLFHLVATAGGLPVPDLLAIVHPTRGVPSVPTLGNAGAVATALRAPGLYPFFAKPIDGIYSLGVLSADHQDALGRVQMADGSNPILTDLADELAGHDTGMLIQRRLTTDAKLVGQFGEQLCSVRLLVLLTAEGPRVARAVCKLPAPGNIADNFWRPGNIVAAIDVEMGVVERAIRGTGREMEIDPEHPKTGMLIKYTKIPGWSDVLDLARDASALFPAVRTQSWDIALTDRGPVLLEVNWGGDLNLAQLAYGRGVLDTAFAAHLAASGYHAKRTQSRLDKLRRGLAP